MLSLRCGPFTGWHAYARATGPCDRLGGVPGSGHFTVTVAGQTLLATPEAGYKLESAQRSILLVDGRGQVGDVGYPMSIPDWQHPGEKVESVQWDAATQRGRVVLDLRPCYGGLSDLTHYHRTFILDEPGRIVCRDVVTFNRPHALAWLFHTRRSFAARLDGAAAVIGQSHGPNLRIEPQVDAFGITPSIAQTAIAWSYASPNHFEPFDHVRFEANAPQQSATIDFIITWSTGTGSTA